MVEKDVRYMRWVAGGLTRPNGRNTTQIVIFSLLSDIVQFQRIIFGTVSPHIPLLSFSYSIPNLPPCKHRIMVRTSQIARDSSEEPVRWIQRDYVDHQGNPVILGKMATYGRQFYQQEPEGIEAYRLQIYSTTPIRPEEFNELYKYLFSEFDQFPFLEIYSCNPPDGLACVEHQRHEVAYRKRLHAGQGEVEDYESLPPLIPTMRTGFNDQFMPGFYFLLTSKSYLKGAFRDNDHGTGPWWISFDRSLPPAVKNLPVIKRLGRPATELQTFKEWGISVNPEIRDIDVDITTDQTGFGFDMRDLMMGCYSTNVCGEFDYGLHEPPSPPTVPGDSDIGTRPGGFGATEANGNDPIHWLEGTSTYMGT